MFGFARGYGIRLFRLDVARLLPMELIDIVLHDMHRMIHLRRNDETV